MRDLVVGTTVVLSDGTVAKSGGKVIKNVAGYDLAKLFAGSFGTLGLIATVSVRLHPLPEQTATVAIGFDDPDALLRARRSSSRGAARGRLLRRRVGARRGPRAACSSAAPAAEQARAAARGASSSSTEDWDARARAASARPTAPC